MTEQSIQVQKNDHRPNAGISDTDLGNRFTYHPPSPQQGEVYAAVRDRALRFASFVVDNTPGSREQSLAVTAIEEAVFWANAAIARRSG